MVRELVAVASALVTVRPEVARDGLAGLAVRTVRESAAEEVR